ncbi:MAG TPA: hypothetical protein VJ836_00775 [Candidatus Saccharimonadales bacterium]|nr:hypothetical protein [Candidatus Saccharimonadales bacterium]
MENPATLTVSYTVTLKAEPDITASDKEVTIKQQIIDQAAALVGNYDWGIAVDGTVESSLTETILLNNAKPDYTEE